MLKMLGVSLSPIVRMMLGLVLAAGGLLLHAVVITVVGAALFVFSLVSFVAGRQYDRRDQP
jgi:hypothetical protein